MEKREFGNTRLLVTPLGVGTAQLGILDIPQDECDYFLNGVLDLGLNVIDTAACYGSEEKVGQALASRREEFVLVSKCGHEVEENDPPEWSPAIVRHSAERSLKRLQTDRLSILLLHSCSKDKLQNGELIEAMLKCKSDGLTEFVGYSGDNEDLAYALDLGVFDCYEASVSICDQQILEDNLPRIAEKNDGLFSKRTLANSCWRDMSEYGEFYEGYAKPYAERLKAMGFTPDSLGFGGDWVELALRFAAFQPGVSVALIGGQNLGHIKDNIEIMKKGPLPQEVVDKIRQAWKEKDDGSWKGET